MTRYSKHFGGGVTAHYNNAQEMKAAEDKSREESIRGLGMLIGFFGGGWLTWAFIMSLGGAEWPKLLRVITTLIGAIAGGAALYWLSMVIMAIAAGALFLGVFGVIIKWFWNAI